MLCRTAGRLSVIGALWMGFASLVVVLTVALPPVVVSAAPPPPDVGAAGNGGNYAVLSWNDLGMHCYNRDFKDLAVLPPYNTLWAQVIEVANPPRVITQGLEITYVFTDNTYSAGKSNFWTYAPQLFGVSLPPNVGLTGKGLSGYMNVHGDHFAAEGIPLTEFRDSQPTVPYPFMLATVIVRESGGVELARTHPVAPVSTEMHCDYCHALAEDGRVAAAGVVETNILALHDNENGTHLLQQRPVLCANCHASNALGKPGVPGVPNLSKAMHAKHHEEGLPDTLTTCYSCHPGPLTQCLRDVMSQQFGLDCIDCHGGLAKVSQNPNPWLNEPTCSRASCHSAQYAQDQPLYRHSRGHGGVYCEACHDSTHAIAPSAQTNDHLKFIELQGDAGPLRQCNVCHLSTPPQGSLGPHNLPAPFDRSLRLFHPAFGTANPGGQAVYRHTLRNSGNVGDTYIVQSTSSRTWAAVTLLKNNSPAVSPVSLNPGEEATIVVTVDVPATAAIKGLREVTTITATSVVSPTVSRNLTDITFVPRTSVFMPVIARR